MPSIAVTRAELSHDEFGDITVIFGRDTIDPQKRKENKVYSKDGWTPTVPQIEYKPSEKVQKRIHDKYYALAREERKDFIKNNKDKIVEALATIQQGNNILKFFYFIF